MLFLLRHKLLTIDNMRNIAFLNLIVVVLLGCPRVNHLEIDDCLILEATNQFIFVGVPNKLKLSSNGAISYDQFALEVNGIFYEPDSKGEFTIIVDRPAVYEFRLYDKSIQDVVLSQTIKGKSLPDPIIHFSGLSPFDKYVNREELVRQKSITCAIYNWNFNVESSVSGFKILIISKSGGNSIELFSDSSQLTSVQLSEIKKLKKGDYVILFDVEQSYPYFSNIKNISKYYIIE